MVLSAIAWRGWATSGLEIWRTRSTESLRHTSDPHVFFVVGVFPAGHDCPKDMRDRYMNISYVMERVGLDSEEVDRNLECYLIKKFEEP